MHIRVYMLTIFEECDKCGVDAEKVEWRDIEWTFVDEPTVVDDADTRNGKAFVCTECGHIHSISQPSLTDEIEQTDE